MNFNSLKEQFAFLLKLSFAVFSSSYISKSEIFHFVLLPLLLKRVKKQLVELPSFDRDFRRGGATRDTLWENPWIPPLFSNFTSWRRLEPQKQFLPNSRYSCPSNHFTSSADWEQPLLTREVELLYQGGKRRIFQIYFLPSRLYSSLVSTHTWWGSLGTPVLKVLESQTVIHISMHNLEAENPKYTQKDYLLILFRGVFTFEWDACFFWTSEEKEVIKNWITNHIIFCWVDRIGKQTSIHILCDRKNVIPASTLFDFCFFSFFWKQNQFRFIDGGGIKIKVAVLTEFSCLTELF